MMAACTAVSHAEAFSYPKARRADTQDMLHGVSVADPYRWMEDIDSAETRAWVEAEAKLSGNYLAKLPRRAEIAERLKKLWDYDRIGLPHTENGRIFFSRRTGLQNQGVLYWKAGPDAPEQVLLDPNQLSPDGTVALAGYEVSRDGRLLAYGLSRAGSDWNEWRIREIDSGKDLPDLLQWIKFSRCSFNHAGNAIYYSRYDAPPDGQSLKLKNENQKLYLHRLGEAQEKDVLLFHRPDKPKWMVGAGESDDGRYLFLGISEGSAAKNAVFYRDLGAGPDAPFIELFGKFDAEYRIIGNDGSTAYVQTTHQAPNQKLMAVDLTRPGPENWRTILPESKSLLGSVHYLSGQFIATRLVDAHDEVTVHARDGRELRRVPVPNLGSVGGFGGHQDARQTHYVVTGFSTPGEIYRYDVPTGKSELVERTNVAFDPEAYQVRQVFYPSRDGTRIPLFLVHRRGIKQDGLNPTMLYGYGGFDNALTPSFSPSLIAWMDMGGIYAMANLRGGGEYGQAWHEAGKRLHKQNVFDDFISAAEWLIRDKFTSPQKLAISGGSNGGLLVAACLNQRPELFGAALPAVGVHDMLRFHKFTIGWAWQEEYGSPDQAEDFHNLLKYSPLHNVKPGVNYPPTLICTADHDDRVFPAHSFKYAATLQQAQTGPAPVLLRVDLKAGHGAGKPTTKLLEETTDKFAFLAEALAMKP